MSTSMAEAIRGAAVGGIEREGDAAVRQRYVFGNDFAGFSGHFPGRPILPAVVQIMAANLLVDAATGLRRLPAAIGRAKFVNPIVPGALVEIACRRLPGDTAEVWETRVASDGLAAASFSLTLNLAADTP